MRLLRFSLVTVITALFWLGLTGAASAQTGYGDDVEAPRVLGVQIDAPGDLDQALTGDGDGGISDTTTVAVAGAAALALLGGGAIVASGGWSAFLAKLPFLK